MISLVLIKIVYDIILTWSQWRTLQERVLQDPSPDCKNPKKGFGFPTKSNVNRTRLAKRLKKWKENF